MPFIFEDDDADLESNNDLELHSFALYLTLGMIFTVGACCSKVLFCGGGWGCCGIYITCPSFTGLIDSLNLPCLETEDEIEFTEDIKPPNKATPNTPSPLRTNPRFNRNHSDDEFGDSDDEYDDESTKRLISPAVTNISNEDALRVRNNSKNFETNGVERGDRERGNNDTVYV